MAFYLCKIQGLQNATAPWSMRFVMSSALAEGAVQTAFDSAALAMWQQATLAPYIPALTTLTRTSTSTASATFKQTTVSQSVHSIAGTSVSKSLGYGVSECLTLRTANATRWGRGRVFMPALAINAVDTTTGYIILPAAMSALVLGWQAFFTALAGNVTPVILHRHGSLDGTRGINSTDPVTTHDISNKFVVQKRRGSHVAATRSAV